jgi:glucans biosynthesis protein
LEIFVIFKTLKAMARRSMFTPLLCLTCITSLSSFQVQAFSLDDVAKQAKQLSDKPYRAPANNLPKALAELPFADYQKIRSRSERFTWADSKSPFKLAFYHQGMHFNSPVKINEVTATRVQEIAYDPQRFDFGDLKFDPKTTQDLGYAGFRVLYPINSKDHDDEIMSLLGASYFRVIGKNQVYGLSARGLGIDTAQASGEEFPYFKEFWVERPKPQDRHLVIFALLDSPRATGAYRFILRPGKDSVVDVKSRIFLRDNVSSLGIAPLTSMFLYGPNQRPNTLNYRPALHDSNGLAIHTGSDEHIWRPLNNPQNLAVSSFTVENPKGFGLLQRGRAFAQYEDLDDRYDQRPSAWIEPKGHWGKGTVKLVEIPTPDETNDNIVAFWSPQQQPAPGQAMAFDYRIHWSKDEPALLGTDIAWVKQTLRSAGEVKQSNLIRKLDGSIALLVDFQGPVLAKLKPDAAVTANVSVSDNAELLDNNLRYNPVSKGWRLTLRLQVKDPKSVVEMRAALVKDDKTLSETWSYQLPPNTAAER